MKVVHLSYSDKRGGAAIAAYRLNEAMNRAGIHSSMLVLDKCTDNATVIAYNTKFKKIKWLIFCALSKIIELLTRPFAAFSLNFWGYDCSYDNVVKEADVIYIHWINSHFMSLKSIRRVLDLNKPTVFFMHDMWHITGGCHHSLECEKYEKQCEMCPLLQNRNGSKRGRDVSYFQFNAKKRYFSEYSNILVATPSEWLNKKVRKSFLFKLSRTIVFNNLIDTEKFIPQNQTDARKKLKLPLDKKLILFGADNIHSPYKGWKYLAEAIKKFDDDWVIVLFGRANEVELMSKINHPYISMGSISSEENLVDLFSASDVFICPSLVDNYPNVILEAASCGLPTVAFSVGGIPEMIEHKETGYLTELGNSQGLIDGISWVINNKRSAGNNARNKVIETNSYNRVIVLQ